MEKIITHYVILRPENVNAFSQLKGQIVEKDGLMHCCSVEYGPHYLQVEASLVDLSGKETWLSLSIPHSLVLYVASFPEDSTKQILGFRASPCSVDTQKDSVAH